MEHSHVWHAPQGYSILVTRLSQPNTRQEVLVAYGRNGGKRLTVPASQVKPRHPGELAHAI